MAEYKLCKIEHDRCGEHAGTTYLWAPAEYSEAEFLTHVECAEKKLLGAEQALRDAALERREGFDYYLTAQPPRMTPS